MAGVVEDELDPETSPFLRDLNKKHASLWKRIQDDQCMVLVPQRSALGTKSLSSAMIKDHVFRPSPFHKDLWSPLSDQMKTVAVSGNSVELREGYGKDNGQLTRVLVQETFYSGDMKPFQVLCIQNALGKWRRSLQQEDLLEPLLDLQQRMNFIDTFCGGPGPSLEREMSDFVSTFFVAKGYLQDAVDRVQQLVSKANERFMKQSRANADKVFFNDPRFSGLMHEAAGAYVIKSCYRKLEQAFVQEHEQDDAHIHRLYDLCEGAEYDKLFGIVGLSEDWVCDLTVAGNQLAAMAQCHTIPEKVQRLEESVGTTLAAIEMEQQQRKLRLGAALVSSTAVTSDELIPLLACVVVASKIRQPFSQHSLMQTFSNLALASEDSASQAAFHLVTLEAALRHLQHEEVQERARRYRQRHPRESDGTRKASLFEDKGGIEVHVGADGLPKSPSPPRRADNAQGLASYAADDDSDEVFGKTRDTTDAATGRASSADEDISQDDEESASSSQPAREINLPPPKSADDGKSSEQPPELGPSLSRLSLFGF